MVTGKSTGQRRRAQPSRGAAPGQCVAPGQRACFDAPLPALLACIEQAGHGEEDLDALAHHQLNLALLPCHRRALLAAHKGQLLRAEQGGKGGGGRVGASSGVRVRILNSRLGGARPRRAARSDSRQRAACNAGATRGRCSMRGSVMGACRAALACSASSLASSASTGASACSAARSSASSTLPGGPWRGLRVRRIQGTATNGSPGCGGGPSLKVGAPPRAPSPPHLTVAAILRPGSTPYSARVLRTARTAACSASNCASAAPSTAASADGQGAAMSASPTWGVACTAGAAWAGDVQKAEGAPVRRAAHAAEHCGAQDLLPTPWTCQASNASQHWHPPMPPCSQAEQNTQSGVHPGRGSGCFVHPQPAHLPHLLGDEGHEGVGQLEDLVVHVHQHRPRLTGGRPGDGRQGGDGLRGSQQGPRLRGAASGASTEPAEAGRQARGPDRRVGETG